VDDLPKEVGNFYIFILNTCLLFAATNQTATYQPPERADDSRPRKANARRRKVK
jgi:hypothetical protein